MRLLRISCASRLCRIKPGSPVGQRRCVLADLFALRDAIATRASASDSSPHDTNSLPCPVTAHSALLAKLVAQPRRRPLSSGYPRNPVNLVQSRASVIST
ncbi:hypothetical protein [Chitinolyticbacter albus]|uniref:hypothetical protein n=1 Tax=Chitinolyticbacter albus TaxID=2961951 RepID=UPI002108EC7C|nr:hypothetical protein [Chitinolyticbacter albus]